MSDHGPLLVLERPAFSRWGVRVSMSVLAAFYAALLLSSWSFEGKVIAGTFVVLATPFLLLVWYRVAQRLELDATGITVVNRFSSRHTPWPALDIPGLPNYNWNDDVVPMPAGLDSTEPAFVLEPPRDSRADERHLLRVQSFFRFGDGWGFRLCRALLALRHAEPDGDWRRQLVTVFRARETHNRTRSTIEIPRARVG